MNALDVDIPALDDYTSTIYSGIIDNATEQLNALKEAEEEARKAAEEAAKQAARNSARRSSGGGSGGNDTGEETEFDLSGLFGNKGGSGKDSDTGGAGSTSDTDTDKKSTATKKKINKNSAKTKRTVTTPASSYLTGRAQTTETPYAAAQSKQNSARRSATRTGKSDTKTSDSKNNSTNTMYWSTAARTAAGSGENETAYQVVNTYREQNENARRLWNLDGRTARGSRAQTEARNRMTEQELQTYDQMRELYITYGPLWSAAHPLGSNLTGLAQQVGGSFVTLGESIIPAILDASDQVAAQSIINELVRRGEASELDAKGNVVATPETQRAAQG